MFFNLNRFNDDWVQQTKKPNVTVKAIKPQAVGIWNVQHVSLLVVVVVVLRFEHTYNEFIFRFCVVKWR